MTEKTVRTGGPIRGLVSRWLMRVQAVQGLLALLGIGVAAASTLTSALFDVGRPELAPYLLAVGLVGSPVFAFLYVELGFFNRKNREVSDRGSNWVGPGQAIDKVTQAAAVGAAIQALSDDEDAEEAAISAAKAQLRELRNGVDVDAFLSE